MVGIVKKQYIYAFVLPLSMIHHILWFTIVYFFIVWYLATVMPDRYVCALIPVVVSMVVSNHIIESTYILVHNARKSVMNIHIPRTTLDDWQVLDFCLQIVTECVLIGLVVSYIVQKIGVIPYI